RQEQQALWERREKRARDERFRRIEQAVDHAQATISRADPAGGRLIKKKMKAVKSLERRFEREDREMTQRPNVEWGIDASFDPDIVLPRGKIVVDWAIPALSVGDRILARDVRLRVTGPEKVLIAGPNGCGKSTLLRALWEDLRDRRDLRPFYMPQRLSEALDERLTPEEYLYEGDDKENRTKARVYLGALRFTREETAWPIRDLSGGQKTKLLFLKMILTRADVLLLDEPTRSLSPLSAPRLRDQLAAFPGAVICVTHDRLLIERMGGRLLRLTPEGLTEL
ncbi:MAG: ABC-F family ATP-binding cassette domain-containing protein, partial [Clostridia bacterium]|nr:ABC-F family ATP-binding cassette domain-containing protein [Clostridia bacterium]